MTAVEVFGEEYTFIKFEDASDAFSNDNIVWCVELHDERGRSFDAYYFPGKYENFIVQSLHSITDSDARMVSKAAFCFLAVILINPDD